MLQVFVNGEKEVYAVELDGVPQEFAVVAKPVAEQPAETEATETGAEDEAKEDAQAEAAEGSEAQPAAGAEAPAEGTQTQE